MFVELFGVGRLGGVWCWVVVVLGALGLELSISSNRLIPQPYIQLTFSIFDRVRGLGRLGPCAMMRRCEMML